MEELFQWYFYFCRAIMGTIDAFKRLSSIPHQDIQPGNMTHAVETIMTNIIGNVTHN